MKVYKIMIIVLLFMIIKCDEENKDCEDHMKRKNSPRICNDGYTTHNENEVCCHKMKEQYIAFILELIIAFGAGHFYIGNYGIAIAKLIFWIIGWSSVVVMRIFAHKKELTHPSTYKAATISMLLFLIMIIWWIVDIVLIGLNKYRDSKGELLNSW